MSNVGVGIGQSSLADSYEAGRKAASDALKNLGMKSDVLIVFGSCRFDHRRLLAGVVSVAGDIPMVGGTTSGEIFQSGFATQSVVIMMLASDALSFTTGIGLDMSSGEGACARALVENLRKKSGEEEPLSLIVLPNGMGGDGVKFIEGLHSLLGQDVEIVGGCLADDERFESTFQFYNGKVFRDAAVGLMIGGKSSFQTGIGVRSGFESIGNRFFCTESEDNVVKQFDGEPALKLYKEFLGEERAKRLPGICLEYPFGLIDEKVSIGEAEYFELRCGLTVNHQKGTITLAASIPEGSPITLTTGSREDIINGARLAAEQARESLGGVIPRAVLMFSCVGRKLVLGRRTAEEVLAVKKVLGEDVPIIGFYTYGEIGPLDKTKVPLSITKFHNETVVLWVLGEK